MNKLFFNKVSSVLLSSLFLFSSCATIVSKSKYNVVINSNPSNAKIIITSKNGVEVFTGTTPTTIKLRANSGFFAKEEYLVKLSSPGYDDRIVPITFKLDGWYFGNILIGGLIGMLIVDPATGAMWKVKTNFLNETLTKSTVSNKAEFQILDINDIPENWRNYLVKVN